MDKHKRYRNKCVSEGRCPRCGKPCAPYYQCEDHYEYKRSYRRLEYLVKVGMLGKKRQKTGENIYWLKDPTIKLKGRAKGYRLSPDDIRRMPRNKKKYFNIKALIKDVFRYTKKALSAEEVSKRVINRIVILKKTA